jgi:signal transduction histidine kinase
LKFHRSDTPPEIKISYRPFDKYSCQIVVEDNGIGFDAKYSEQIFGIFERLHGRSQYEGTGIGLAICKKIVERHGGTITVHSIPDQGSSFMIALPYQQNDTSIPPIPDIEVIS